MLCPSEGMKETLDTLPLWLLWPTYRTPVIILFFLISFPVSYIYIGISLIIRNFLELITNNEHKKYTIDNLKEYSKRTTNKKSNVENRHIKIDKVQ
jgi:uncharacterized membrane protein YcfT